MHTAPSTTRGVGVRGEGGGGWYREGGREGNEEAWGAYFARECRREQVAAAVEHVALVCVCARARLVLEGCFDVFPKVPDFNEFKNACPELGAPTPEQILKSSNACAKEVCIKPGLLLAIGTSSEVCHKSTL